jgi:hypothetical protein
MNVQKLAKLFGIVFVLVGILGFVPGITTDNHLLGIFEVDVLHNIIHLATGLIAFWAASTMANSRLFFKLFGVIYALVTILGFMMGGSILGLFMVNAADNFLHLVIALVALYAGFMMKE